METNKYKNINQYNYMSTDRLFNLLKMNLTNLKHFTNDYEYISNTELKDIVYEIDMIQHILKLRLYNIVNYEK